MTDMVVVAWSRLGVVAGLAFLFLLMGIEVVYACFDPSNLGSIEVVFSKPGVAYDFSPLRSLRNVVRIRYGWGWGGLPPRESCV